MGGMQICSGCDRHVRADEPQCPFCGIPSTTIRSAAPRWALALIAGSLLATASCDKGEADKPKTETKSKSESKSESKTDSKSDGGDAKTDTKADTKTDTKSDGGDTKADDGGNAAGSTGAGDANAGGSSGGSAPVDDGDAAGDDGSEQKPIAKPKYGLARPRPKPEPRPAKKYGAPPRPSKPEEPLPPG